MHRIVTLFTPHHATLAAIHLDPGGIIAWIIVGGVAGWLAGQIIRGRSFGCLGNVIIGWIGAGIGGFVFSFFVGGQYGTCGSIIVATGGAILLLWLVKLLTGDQKTP